MDKLVIKNGVLEKYTGNDEHVVIPEGTVAIGNWVFNRCSKLASIVIPDSVTSIGASAFRECSNLASISIPDSVTSIGFSAFKQCSMLTHITIPDSVSHLGDQAFHECSSLISIVLPEGITSIDKDAFYGCDQLQQITIPGISFSSCASKFKIAVLRGFLNSPDSYSDAQKAEYIDYMNRQKKKCLNMALAYNDIVIFTRFEQFGIEIPPAFRDELIDLAAKEKKTEVQAWLMDYKNRTADYKKEAERKARTLENQLANPYMAKYLKADWSWSKLETGTIRIDKYKGKAADVIVPSFVGKTPVTCIGDNAFSENSNLTSVVIPESITHIGEYAFYACPNLTDVSFSQSPITIGTCAFHDTPWLMSQKACIVNDILFAYQCDEEEYTIPTGVTRIEDKAFAYCDVLTALTIPEGVVSIGELAFHGCTALQSISLPDSLQKIGRHIFRGCTQLKTITASNAILKLANASFALAHNLVGINVAVAENSNASEDDELFIYLVEDFGGIATTTVTNKTTCLIANEHDTSVTVKNARDLSIPILTMEQFFAQYFPEGVDY